MTHIVENDTFYLNILLLLIHCLLLLPLFVRVLCLVLVLLVSTIKRALSGHSKRRQTLVFKTDYRFMQVKSSWSKVLLTLVMLPFVTKIIVLSIFEWLL